MADIIYNDFDEEWISLDDKSFYDGDIHSQLARAYACALETTTGVSASGFVFLYNLTSTPHPTASDVVDSDQDMWSIVKFLAVIYSNLIFLLQSQPYTPSGETGNWYWGEPGTEADPTNLIVPLEFISIANPISILAGFFDADAMPPAFSLREYWHSTITEIRSMLSDMQFIYKTATTKWFCWDKSFSTYPYTISGNTVTVGSVTDPYVIFSTNKITGIVPGDLGHMIKPDYFSAPTASMASRIRFYLEGDWEGVEYEIDVYRAYQWPELTDVFELLGTFSLSESTSATITAANYCDIPGVCHLPYGGRRWGMNESIAGDEYLEALAASTFWFVIREV